VWVRVKGAVGVAAQVAGVEPMSEAAERGAVPGLVERGAVASGNRLR